MSQTEFRGQATIVCERGLWRSQGLTWAISGSHNGGFGYGFAPQSALWGPVWDHSCTGFAPPGGACRQDVGGRRNHAMVHDLAIIASFPCRLRHLRAVTHPSAGCLHGSLAGGMRKHGASSVVRRARKAVPEVPRLCTKLPSGATKRPPSAITKGPMDAFAAHRVPGIVI